MQSVGHCAEPDWGSLHPQIIAALTLLSSALSFQSILLLRITALHVKLSKKLLNIQEWSVVFGELK